MSALSHPTVLDWFRSQKHQPMIQFLTWYLVLTLEWKLEELTHLTISTMEPLWHIQRWNCAFTFRDGKKVSLIVTMNMDQQFYVESQTEVIQPSAEEAQ